jgi:hypothetical protein
MAHMTVKITWDKEDLGPMWMNEDNLKLLLFTDSKTNEDLIQIQVTEHSEKWVPPND